MNARAELDSLNARLTREAEVRFGKAILDVKYPQDAPHSEDDVRHHRMKETMQAISQTIVSIGEARKSIGSILGLASSTWGHTGHTKQRKDRGL